MNTIRLSKGKASIFKFCWRNSSSIPSSLDTVFIRSLEALYVACDEGFREAFSNWFWFAWPLEGFWSAYCNLHRARYIPLSNSTCWWSKLNLMRSSIVFKPGILTSSSQPSSACLPSYAFGSQYSAMGILRRYLHITTSIGFCPYITGRWRVVCRLDRPQMLRWHGFDALDSCEVYLVLHDC